MKSKTKKSDKKSTASRGQGSTQHRLTSGGVRTSPPPPPPHETTLSTAVVSPDASPLPGGQSLTVRIASKTLGRKSCEPTGNGHSLKEGSEVTGSEPVGTSVASVGGSDTAPEVVEEPEMKQRVVISVEGSGSSSSSNSSSSNNHQTPPTKRMKMMMSRETQPSSSSSLSSAERCNAGVLTDPDCLGPCDPGSSVILEGIVWNESRNGLLVVNVTWRGKTYVGTLMDSTNHNWASPSFKEDSLSTDNNSSSRDEDGGGGGVAMAPEGRRLRRCRTMQPSNGVMTSAASSAASSSSASTTSTTSSKTSTTRTTKCRVQVGDNSVQTDPVNNPQQNVNGNGSDAGILCPELHCQRKFKHESALRNHRFRAHKATDSIATSAFATSSAVAASATSSARSIVDDDSVGSALTTAQSKGPSLLLQAKQRSFDGDEDVSSSANAGAGGRGIKKTEDAAPRLCVEKDGSDGLEAEDCSAALIKSASGMMENNKLDCFVRSSSRCLQSTPIICGGLLQMSSCAKLASSTAEMENGTGDAALDSSDCLPVSDSAVPMRDGGECIVVCADRQKMRNSAKKDCKGRADRVQKHSETVVASSAGLAPQMFGQSSSAAVADDATSAAAGASAAGASAGALSLQSSEDKHCVKRLKTNGGMPFSMLSVSLNRIPMESESSLARKTVPATETRSDDRSQDAEKTGSSCSTGVDSVRGLGLDVAKLCIVSGFGSSPGREPSAGKAPSQSLFAMREVMGRYPMEKTQVDNSNCHPVLLVKAGGMHTEEIAKPQLESCPVLQGKSQNGSDCQTSSDRALTPSKPGFQSSKTCHDKLLAPGFVRDGNQKQAGLHSGSSLVFATDSSKSLLNHVGKESIPVSHLSYVDKTKPELCTSSAKGIQTSAFSSRNSTGESIGSHAVKQKICPSFSNPDLAITDRGMATSAVSSGGSGPTLYTKDMMMNSFTNVQKDFSDLKGVAMPSRSTIPFAVPIGSSRSLPNGSLTWTTSPFVPSMSSLQHTTTMMRSNASSDPPPPPPTSRGSTYVTALAASMSSSLTADCSFVPFCRAIQGAPATTPLPKQINKFCAPLSPPLSSCPLEANTASEVFVRRIDDGLWTSAAVGGGGGKSAQQHATTTIISNSSCPDRNVLVCGDISLPLPLQPPPSSSSTTDLHHGGGGGGAIPYQQQQKKEKLVSTLHSSGMKPTLQSSSTSSRSLLTGHSVQAACPK